ncbi:hypothetical protein PENSPDRAFT_679837 [Peniophora sp. CONT]|nr:hypothetical protein PENSPDRAFT_679837 [Peniophora sp. CONT]
MDVVASPQKRARAEDDLDLPPLPIVSCRSEELFLADGNIVLRTRSIATSGEPPVSSVRLTHYRVHKAVLGLNCAAFKDLLEGMSDDAFGNSEMFEGVPVMDTHDEQKDLDVFLKAIYLHDWIHDSYDTDPEGFLYTSERLLKLAKKYDAVAIRKTVIKILEWEWPSEYWTWENVALPSLETYSGPRWARDPVLAIRLGRDYDIPSILPAAMYELCVLYELYDHTRDPDLAVSHWTIEAGDWPDRMTDPLDLSKLDVEDFKRLWLGRGALHSRWIRTLQNHYFLETIRPLIEIYCLTAEKCARTFDQGMRAFRGSRNPVADPNPFSCLRDARVFVQNLYGLCGICRDKIIVSVFDPLVFWGELPGMFDLPQALPPSS